MPVAAELSSLQQEVCSGGGGKVWGGEGGASTGAGSARQRRYTAHGTIRKGNRAKEKVVSNRISAKSGPRTRRTRAKCGCVYVCGVSKELRCGMVFRKEY